MYYSDCHYFNFYSEQYEGQFKHYCVLFNERLGDDRIPMKGVISGNAYLRILMI